ncbi:MAG: bacillithiol biosynthesis deacetylase BshB1 [Candidatus Zixiibacteriota bacterium]
MGDKVQLDVLAIAAHPDDVEITCGGMMIKLGGLGRKTGVLDLTRGEMGTQGDATIRDSEASAAADAMGLTFRESLSLPDSAIEYAQSNKLKIAQVIRNTKPELVVLPHWEQRHPDHLACSRLGYDACFLAGLKKVDLGGEPFRPRKIIYASYFRNTDYSFFVDISDVFEQKVKAVAAYQSQFGEKPGVKDIVKAGLNLYDLVSSGGKSIFQPGINIFDLIHTRARQFGQVVGVQYAEAFTIKEQILVDDPQKMPVQSI